MGTFRRRVMMATIQSVPSRYIEDGLVFHLDGIDKGLNEGKWTDLVSGIIYTPDTKDGALNYNNCCGTFTADNSKFADWYKEDCTLEICYKNTMASVPNFISNIKGTPALGNTRGALIYGHKMPDGATEIATAYNPSSLIKNAPVRVSVNTDSCFINGIAVENLNSQALVVDTTGDAKTSYISPYKSEGHISHIYSIRIYNRHLTEKEILHNQTLDCEKFDLRDYGKTIYVLSTASEVGLWVGDEIVNYKVTPNRYSKIVIDTGNISIINGFSEGTRDSIIGLDFTNLDVSTIDKIRFSSCHNLKVVSISNFAPTTLSSIAFNDSSLESLYFNNCDFSNVYGVSMSWVNCSSLRNLIFGRNMTQPVALQAAPLTHESAVSVIDGLGEVTSSKVLQFSPETYLTLSYEDIALATNKGWNVVLPSAFSNKVMMFASANSGTIPFKVNEQTIEYPNYPGNVDRTLILKDTITSFKDFAREANLRAAVLSMLSDFSEGNISLNSMFRNNHSLGTVQVPTATLKSDDLSSMFENCTILSTIDLSFVELLPNAKVVDIFKQCQGLTTLYMYTLDLSKLSQEPGNVFNFEDCRNLQNVTFGYNCKHSLHFDICSRLTHNSAKSIINGLAEVDSEVLAFSRATYATLTQEEIAIATAKGWTVTGDGINENDPDS